MVSDETELSARSMYSDVVSGSSPTGMSAETPGAPSGYVISVPG